MPASKCFSEKVGKGGLPLLEAEDPQKWKFACRRLAFYEKSAYFSKLARNFLNLLTIFFKISVDLGFDL